MRRPAGPDDLALMFRKVEQRLREVSKQLSRTEQSRMSDYADRQRWREGGVCAGWPTIDLLGRLLPTYRPTCVMPRRSACGCGGKPPHQCRRGFWPSACLRTRLCLITSDDDDARGLPDSGQIILSSAVFYSTTATPGLDNRHLNN